MLLGYQVRLPPQSPSRYIRAGAGGAGRLRPVAPAVSKSLHSRRGGGAWTALSGCPRSLQVATFRTRSGPRGARVRLPPQSPSRYIRQAAKGEERQSPVAPAVSKSLHSSRAVRPVEQQSGCPRSLQVATFPADPQPERRRVRLPPQSPSRYIRHVAPRRTRRSPVAPAVSKSLHSTTWECPRWVESGCPRSLQVATFLAGSLAASPDVRLPPQSPSRYIQAERSTLFGLNFLLSTEDRCTGTRPFGSNEPTTGSSLRSQVPPRGECRPSPTKPSSPSAHGRSRYAPHASARSPSRSRWRARGPCFA